MSLLLQGPEGMGSVTINGNSYTCDGRGKVVAGHVDSIRQLIREHGFIPLTETNLRGVDGMSTDIRVLQIKQKASESDEQLERELEAFAQGYKLIVVKNGVAVVYR